MRKKIMSKKSGSKNIRSKMSSKLKKTRLEDKDLDKEPAPFKFKPAKPRGG